MTEIHALVGVVMGSDSDLKVMRAAADTLTEFGVPYEVRVVSAHRTPIAMLQYAQTADSRGLRIIIAGAGGAACTSSGPAGSHPQEILAISGTCGTTRLGF